MESKTKNVCGFRVQFFNDYNHVIITAPDGGQDVHYSDEAAYQFTRVVTTEIALLANRLLLPENYREEWKRNVMLMWSCVRKHDSNIPSDVLDYMRDELLSKL